MTNESYNNVKNKYNELISKRESIDELQSRLKKLEENKAKLELDLNVQAYVSILEQIDQIIKMLPSLDERKSMTDEHLLWIAANQVILEQNTNNIYVYMGTYDYSSEGDIVHGSRVIELPDDSTDFGWKLYKNIELVDYYADKIVPKQELGVFEKETTILYAPKDTFPDIFYRKVKKVFFETLIKFGQEEAVKKIKSEFDMKNIAPISEEGPKLVKNR